MKFFELTFYRCVVLYICMGSLLGGWMVSLLNPGLDYVDGLFLATSSLTATGLATVEMRDLSGESLLVIFVMMIMGSTLVLLLPPMLYRRAVFFILRPRLVQYLDEHGKADRPSMFVLKETLSNGDLTYRALGMVILAIGIYLAFWMVGGTIILYCISLAYEDPAETRARGFSKLSVSVFLSISSFCNCGFTLTSDSLMPYQASPSPHDNSCTACRTICSLASLCRSDRSASKGEGRGRHQLPPPPHRARAHTSHRTCRASTCGAAPSSSPATPPPPSASAPSLPPCARAPRRCASTPPRSASPWTAPASSPPTSSTGSRPVARHNAPFRPIPGP